MEQPYLEKEKVLAAEAAAKLVNNGMIVGLGSGSTATHMVKALGQRVQQGLSMAAVPSSEKTAKLARSLGIVLYTLERTGRLDINIDGADEFDTEFRLIKGGGGALLREKILAHNTKCNVIIADSSKQVRKLGGYKLPLETIPFATHNIKVELDALSLSPELRRVNGHPYRTDENNFILDIDISFVRDIEDLNLTLLQIPGVVETGLFLGTTDVLIMGKGQETIRYDIKDA